ncbi:hypothetical protein PG984_013363 [Apiospora sp. TS-2023a]
MAAIILHTVRSKLLFGSDFLGAITSNWKRWRQDWFLIGLLLAGGSLALLAGPASAVIMLPREMDWPVGGSNAQLWPTNLTAGYFPIHQEGCAEDEHRLEEPKCPSASYLLVANHLSRWWQRQNLNNDFEFFDRTTRKIMYGRAGEPGDTWTYTTHASVGLLLNLAASHYYQSLTYLKDRKKNKIPERYMSLNWAEKTYKVDTRVPAVRVVCMVQEKVNLAQEKVSLAFPTLDHYTVYYKDTKGNPNSQPTTFDITEPLRESLLERGFAIQNSSGFFMASDAPGKFAVPLKVPSGNASSISLALFNHVREKNKPITWSPIACTVDAQWMAAETYIKIGSGGFSGGRVAFNYPISQGGEVIRTQLKKESAPVFAASDYVPRSLPSPDAWEHIKVHTSWLTEVLSPSVADAAAGLITRESSSHNRSLVDRLLDYTDFPSYEWTDDYYIVPRTRTLELGISMFFSDSLSRCGLSRHGPISSLIPPWPTDEDGQKAISKALVRVNKDPDEWFAMPDELRNSASGSTRVVMRAIFTGYVMTSRNWFDRLCLFFLLLHVAVVVIHVGVSFVNPRELCNPAALFNRNVLRNPKVSEAWDSAVEMLVLAQQSSPAEAPLLDNTCAGIRARKTMGRIATVEVQQNGKSDGSFSGEEMQLRFGDSGGNRSPESIPEACKSYGHSVASCQAAEVVRRAQA